MTSEYDRRAAIVIAIRAGCSRSAIAEFLKLPLPQCLKSRTAAEEDEAGSGDATRKLHDRSMSRKRSLDFERLEELVEEDSSQSTRTLAGKLDVSATTIRQAIKEDL